MTEDVDYPVWVTGKIVKGFGRGSKELGIPTANVDSEAVKQIPLSNGIYFGWSQLTIQSDQFNQLDQNQRDKLRPILEEQNGILTSSVFMMSASLGYNPYYANQEKSLEVHIIHQFDTDLYNFNIKSAICGKIRDEANFSSLEELISTIHNDIKITEQQLSSDKWVTIRNDSKFLNGFS